MFFKNLSLVYKFFLHFSKGYRPVQPIRFGDASSLSTFVTRQVGFVWKIWFFDKCFHQSGLHAYLDFPWNLLTQRPCVRLIFTQKLN